MKWKPQQASSAQKATHTTLDGFDSDAEFANALNFTFFSFSTDVISKGIQELS